MLEYAKIILQKVSFDSFLFEKELRKAIASLGKEEWCNLYVWCTEAFGDKYPDVIQKLFNNFTGL